MSCSKERRKISCILSIFFISFINASISAQLRTIENTKKDTLHTGIGSFVYTGYKPLEDKPVTVYYYVPEDLPEDAPIVILMHGNSRAALNYRKAMIPWAEQYKFLLIVPLFSKEYYPGSRDYHQGGVFTKDGQMKVREAWTFSIIEPLFDYVKEITGKRNKGYILYGFSAGAQFIHRFTFFVPDNHALQTISSSAGSYTMPDYQVNYIYGLKNTKIPKENLVRAFAKDFTVVVGDADTVLSRSDLPKSPGANKEGRDRVERAVNFFNSARKLAGQQKVPFHWKFVIVPHVGHDQSKMAEPVAKMLFDSMSQRLKNKK